MEIDEHLKYTLYVVLVFQIKVLVTNRTCSLQFDPCPRAGEPMVSRSKLPGVSQLTALLTTVTGTPDYFL